MFIKAFLEYLRSEKNCSERTIASYGSDLEDFERFFQGLNDDITWLSVDADIIRLWVVTLMDDGKLKSTSVNRKLSSLRSFFRYMKLTGEVTSNPALRVTGPRKPHPLPYFVKEGEIDRLLDDIAFGDDHKGLRDHLIIQLFYETGMRLSELVNLCDRDVDYTSCRIKVTGKGDKQRYIPFGEGLKSALTEYVSKRDATFATHGDSLLLNDKGEPISRWAVERIVKKNLSKVTSISKRSPHVLRHTFATSMLNHHADLLSIKELLGHASLQTTEIYTHTSFEELKSVYKKSHPRSIK